MYNHAPEGYQCPFCRVVAGLENEGWNYRSDVVLQTEYVTAFVSPTWWDSNAGHVLVVPNLHIENIYDLTPDIAVHVHEAARQIALAFKSVYCCEGTSIRQHNEPGGNQDVFHYHLHVFPRYHGDKLYENYPNYRQTTRDERRRYAEPLRHYLTTVGF